ncbi:hypothetical protein TESG_08665 [Trichophyton tonsurans CBS 112818]|uniref:Uncharacterized protein n=2 Tax=Trichophyton TaxID=5550 RepID=F2PJP5_TRIEC|nr:hypothetical protein TESG_08665 [Trichophyton tonsurans CBS 112818]EGE02113.1 hypothetical protein TEQG_01152 [Trichophyton equinum CBS 127.97]
MTVITSRGRFCSCGRRAPTAHSQQQRQGFTIASVIDREAGRVAGRSVCSRARQDTLCWLVKSGSRGLAPAIELHRQKGEWNKRSSLDRPGRLERSAQAGALGPRELLLEDCKFDHRATISSAFLLVSAVMDERADDTLIFAIPGLEANLLYSGTSQPGCF